MTNNKPSPLTIFQTADLILKHKVESLEVIPAVALKLLRLTNDENSRVTDLSQIIETEPTLTAKVLGNVNSAAFALTHKITSIKRAVNILGFSAVRQMTLNQLFYKKLIQHSNKHEFDPLFFWQHCLFVASLSRAIAIAIKHKDPDSIYTAGLLHDIGKIVLESHGKVSYSDFILACKNDDQSTLHSEHDFFGLNHAEMGYVFCQQWDIPEQISAIVYCHHEMPNSDSPFKIYANDIAIISFANYIAWMQGVGSTPELVLPELDSEVYKNLNLEKLDLEALLSQVDIEMQDTREFYGIHFPSLNKLRATLVQTTILLTNYNQQKIKPGADANNFSSNSLTIPHKSLNPDEIIPWTLAVINRDFKFQRLIMLNIDPRQRSLVSTHSWPESLSTASLIPFNIKMEILPRILLDGLRERKAIIINSAVETNKAILTQFGVEEFLMLPVLSHNRLVALLYVDNWNNKQTISEQSIIEITPIIHELGVALANATRFGNEKKKAEIDPLTGLMNKRMVIEYLTKTFQLKQEHLQQIAVGFIDIDFFKKFNDTCGHQAGDDALKIVAQIMSTLTRPNDFIGRYGGEEFVFILRNTDQQGALSYAERIRLEIERKGRILSQRFQGNSLTISVGISLYQQSFIHYEEMIETADKAMYRAKHNGRNCVVIA